MGQSYKIPPPTSLSLILFPAAELFQQFIKVDKKFSFREGFDHTD